MDTFETQYSDLRVTKNDHVVDVVYCSDALLNKPGTFLYKLEELSAASNNIHIVTDSQSHLAKMESILTEPIRMNQQDQICCYSHSKQFPPGEDRYIISSPCEWILSSSNAAELDGTVCSIALSDLDNQTDFDDLNLPHIEEQNNRYAVISAGECIGTFSKIRDLYAKYSPLPAPFVPSRSEYLSLGTTFQLRDGKLERAYRFEPYQSESSYPTKRNHSTHYARSQWSWLHLACRDCE